MSEKHEFCDHCPGCRPALLDAQGRIVPQDSPIMIAVNRIWTSQTSYAERKSFIDVTVNNSRDPDDLRRAQAVVARFTKAMAHG